MSISPRPELEGLSECPHGVIGKTELGALGLCPDEVIDFSVNCNPCGPTPLLGEALARTIASRYPDSEAGELRAALARRLGLRLGQVIVGNGSVELLWLLTMAYLRPGDTVLILGPTFGEYERASRIAGARVLIQRAGPEAGFLWPLGETVASIEQKHPRLVFLCNPNNPTGVYLGREAIERILKSCQDTLLVLDEAYLGFVEDPWSACDLLEKGNLLLLRSMTKDYALAGLRLGYALGMEATITALKKVQPPWSVNAMAQAAGLVSLQDETHLARSKEVVWIAKAYLMAEVGRLGLRAWPSACNFFLLDVGDATSFRRILLERGICIRDCTSFGMPQFVRIGVRTLGECQRLISALETVLSVRGIPSEG